MNQDFASLTNRLNNLVTFPISSQNVNKRDYLIRELKDLIMNIDSKSFMSDEDYKSADEEYLTEEEIRNIKSNLKYILEKVIK